MTLDDDFVELVRVMRKAQKEYFRVAVDLDNLNRGHLMSKLLPLAKKAETAVDKWLDEHKKTLAQLDAWTASSRTDEEPGAYNAEHDDEAKTEAGE